MTTTPEVSERERRIALYRSIFEETFNHGNLDYVATAFHSHFVLHSPAEPEPRRGHEGWLAFAERVRAGFPDIEITVHDVIVDGDMVVGRMSIEGTHTGVYFGIPPTGRRIDITQIVWGRFEGARIAEAWQELNAIGLMQTLGVVPRPGIGPLGLIGWAFATVGRMGVLQARHARQGRGKGPRKGTVASGVH